MMKKRPLAKSTLHDCLINYIPKPMKRWWSNVKEKLMDLFKTSANKDYCKLFCINSVHRVGKKLGLVNDSLVDNFTCNVYHMNCKHCMKGLWKMWRVWGL